MAVLTRLLAVTVALGLLLVPATAFALEPTAPQPFVHSDVLDPGVVASPIAIRNVVATGDALILTRIEVPELNWATYGVDGALVRLVLDGVSLQDRVPARLGNSIAGFYLEPGHALPWDAGVGSVRLISNPSLFVANAQSDVAIATWLTPNGALLRDSPPDRDYFCGLVLALLQRIEVEDAAWEPGDLVSNEVGTEAGTVMAQQAFGPIASLLPDCFVVGLEGSGIDFNPNEGQLRDNTVERVENTDAWQRWERLADHYNLDPVLLATFIAVGLSFIAMIAVTYFAGPVTGTTAGVLANLAGAMFVPHFLMQIVFIVIAVCCILSGFFILARVPR